eukprot:417918-Prymnesium_polylepis.1
MGWGMRSSATSTTRTRRRARGTWASRRTTSTTALPSFGTTRARRTTTPSIGACTLISVSYTHLTLPTICSV